MLQCLKSCSKSLKHDQCKSGHLMQRVTTSYVPTSHVHTSHVHTSPDILVSVAIFCFADALSQVVEDDLLYLPVSYSFIMTIITISMTMTIISISSKVLVLPADLYSPPKHPAAASWDFPAPHSSHNQAFLPPPGKYLILQSSHQLSPVSWELDLKLSSQKISQNTTRLHFSPRSPVGRSWHLALARTKGKSAMH